MPMTEDVGNVLERLKTGIRKFQEDVYSPNKSEYEYAATHPQQPHTLMITCADSRVDPQTITSSSYGEIFVTRNVGNMVPRYGDMLGGVSAVIEYAVDALRVKHVVVCGHSDCGAMKALLQDEAKLYALPTVKHWLENAANAKQVAASLDKKELPTLTTMTEQNVILQMQHLCTHPSVARSLQRGELSISGWIYDIGEGDVRVYDEQTNTFSTVRSSEEQGK